MFQIIKLEDSKASNDVDSMMYSIYKQKRWQFLTQFVNECFSEKLKFLFVISDINHNYGYYFNSYNVTDERKRQKSNISIIPEGFYLKNYNNNNKNKIINGGININSIKKEFVKENLNLQNDKHECCFEREKTKDAQSFYFINVLSDPKIKYSVKDKKNKKPLRKNKEKKRYFQWDIDSDLHDYYSRDEDIFLLSEDEQYAEESGPFDIFITEVKAHDDKEQLPPEDTSNVVVTTTNATNNSNNAYIRTRPFTSRELKVLMGNTLKIALLELVENRPSNPIGYLANTLYKLADDQLNYSNILKDHLSTVSNLP